jgi:FtsZ-binding cell division protein ZapB
MNANEIADELNGRLDHRAANMIIQQQSEIEKLKEENAELQRLFDKAMDEWEKERRIPK